MPRWWVWTFYATIIWAIGYTIAFPAWPLINGATQGLLGWSSRGEIAADMADAKQTQSVYVDRIASSSLAEIQADPTLRQFALSGGAAAFKVNCIQCHGSGAEGGQGYPNRREKSHGHADQCRQADRQPSRYPGIDTVEEKPASRHS